MELGDDVGAPRGEPVPRGAPPTTALLGPARRLLRDPQQLGVDAMVSLVDEEVEQALPHHDLLPQRDGTVLIHDDVGRAPHGTQPLAELLRVAHRRREGGEQDPLGQEDDHLFPDRPPETIGQIVHLVHHDETELVERRGVRVEHVAEHLSRHDDDGRLAVDRVVAGEQPHPIRAVPLREIVELLVRQGLDGGGVEALATGAQGLVHGELPHDRLAGPGRGRDEHAVAARQGEAALALEVVEAEGIEVGEVAQQGPRA